MADSSSLDSSSVQAEALRFVREAGRVRVQGDLLRASIESLSDFSLPMPDGQTPGTRLEIALGSVGLIDTAGLAFLLGWQAEATAQSVTVRYTHPPKAMRAMMRVYDLDDWMVVEGVS
ncbi:STAS domain-containing protein [Halothiobacillus sp.]|uniref:STAS domain-containing protein n=1 Tax=Halothiobacillus sp. TaxID=1891311 RepID=UPI002624B6AF|nr:STAS domain-containing protein [Halothiobacillus sp.]